MDDIGRSRREADKIVQIIEHIKSDPVEAKKITKSWAESIEKRAAKNDQQFDSFFVSMNWKDVTRKLDRIANIHLGKSDNLAINTLIDLGVKLLGASGDIERKLDFKNKAKEARAPRTTSISNSIPSVSVHTTNPSNPSNPSSASNPSNPSNPSSAGSTSGTSNDSRIAREVDKIVDIGGKIKSDPEQAVKDLEEWADEIEIRSEQKGQAIDSFHVHKKGEDNARRLRLIAGYIGKRDRLAINTLESFGREKVLGRPQRGSKSDELNFKRRFEVKAGPVNRSILPPRPPGGGGSTSSNPSGSATLVSNSSSSESSSGQRTPGIERLVPMFEEASRKNPALASFFYNTFRDDLNNIPAGSSSSSTIGGGGQDRASFSSDQRLQERAREEQSRQSRLAEERSRSRP